MTPRVPWVALLVAIAVATWPAAARAAEVTDPSGGFGVNVELVGARVCVVLPTRPSDDAGCDGIDVDALRKGISAAKEPPFAFVVVRVGDRPHMVTFTKMDVRTVSAESIQATIKGSEDAMKDMLPGVALRVHGDAPADRYDLLQVGGVNVARYAIDVDVPATDPKYVMSRMLCYLVAGRDVSYNVAVTGDRGHADDVRALGDAIMKTLRVPPYKNEDFGRTRDYARGRLMGSLLGTLIAVAGMLGLLILLWRQRNKKKPA